MKFIIVAPARSGSTLFRELLDRHPQACCHGEVFGIQRVLGFSSNASRPMALDEALRLRTRNPARFLTEEVWSSPRPQVGFKLLYTQLFHFGFVPALATLLAATDLRVIHLWRKDLIARHVSEVRLKMKVAQKTANGPPPDFWDNAMRPGAIEKACEANIAARACARSLLRDFPSIDVCYEDFVGRHAEEAGRLCDFLDIDPALFPALPAKGEGDGEAPPLPALSERLAAYADHR